LSNSDKGQPGLYIRGRGRQDARSYRGSG
jgi:hypothetical protein